MNYNFLPNVSGASVGGVTGQKLLLAFAIVKKLQVNFHRSLKYISTPKKDDGHNQGKNADFRT
jgi:hypothetical protein